MQELGNTLWQMGTVLWQPGNVLWQLGNVLWQLGNVLWQPAPIPFTLFFHRRRMLHFSIIFQGKSNRTWPPIHSSPRVKAVILTSCLAFKCLEELAPD